MTDAAPPIRPRRRIDRVTAPDFLGGLEDKSVPEVRLMRDECREEESHLSFARRLLQARLDIVRATVARRGEGGGRGPSQGDLLHGLPDILADDRQPSALGDARIAPLHDPPAITGRRDEEKLLMDSSLGRLPELDDDELLDLVERLSVEERRVSDQRRCVLDRLDTLQAELVRRYAADSSVVSSAVSDIVSSAVGRARHHS